MDEKTIREQIVDIEWNMFQATHNKGGRASCQNDRQTFYNMRRAQFDAWSDEAAESYLEDLRAAADEGRNLVAMKYLNMMKSTHPAEYDAQKHLLPAVSADKAALANEICEELIFDTVALRKAFPNVGKTGRPLFSKDYMSGTSIQEYQLGELLTYSERTLGLLREHLYALRAEGKNLARELMSKSICTYGFSSLEEAESILAERMNKQ